MRNRLGILAASLCLASVASAAAAPSKQALYDQAQAAMDRSDWAAAANGFTPLLPPDPTKPLSQSQAIIAARLGEALMHQGRMEEARGWLSRAIANLPKQPGLTDTWIEAAESARFAYDYEAAARADQVAVELATAANDARTLSLARVGLAQAVMTSDPNRAANALDAVLASDANGMEPLARAQLEQLRARAAIIAGDRSAAEHWIKSALSRSGGLTELKVSTVQAEIRADAAIIARLSGNDEGSREYLSYTGAGHSKNMDWLSRREGAQPACDPDGGVQPDDSVVVRFVIGDDGRVQAAIPVYASRPGPAGVLFAEAVSRWHWAPEELKDVAAYWRGTLRLELRCQSRPAPKTLDEPFHQESVKWLAKTGHLGAVPADDAAALDHAALSSTDPLAELIFPSAFHPLSPFSYEDGERALTAAGAPASVYAMMIYVYAVMHSGGGIRESAGRRADNLGKIVPAFLERAPKEKASYWLELEWALALESAGRFAQAQPLVAQVLSTPEAVLPADDPIRQVAQLHAALIAAQLGTPAAAPSTAGLDAQQCSLLDTHPVPTKAGLSSDIFPKEALRWGFEGHVEEEFDIGSDGRVAHVRTVLAYPPFIFGPDTERAIHDFRYVPPSIGGKAVGCNSQTVRINYRLPG